jgi:hypothetical protein
MPAVARKGDGRQLFFNTRKKLEKSQIWAATDYAQT